MSDRRLLLAWDPSAIINAQAEFLQEEEELSEDEAWERACGDQDLFAFEWECIVGELTDIMEDRELDAGICVESRSFGWRSLDGYKIFYPETGEALLQGVLPETDCTFYIYEDGENGLAINNFHHDSPVGREWYYLRPATEEELESAYA